MARFRLAAVTGALWSGVGDADSRSALGGLALAAVSDQGLEQRQSLAVSSDPGGSCVLTDSGCKYFEVQRGRRHCAACIFQYEQRTRKCTDARFAATVARDDDLHACC